MSETGPPPDRAPTSDAGPHSANGGLDDMLLFRAGRAARVVDRRHAVVGYRVGRAVDRLVARFGTGRVLHTARHLAVLVAPVLIVPVGLT
ncbi:MAG TPA: hypothetical protein VGE11_19015 [Pseudonocardia sp.]